VSLAYCRLKRSRIYGTTSHQLESVKLPRTRSICAAEESIPSPQLEALLDKLVAVRMDLEPICRVGKERAQVVASLESIANACDARRSRTFATSFIKPMV
jgi:hypothetical protein